MRRLIKTSMAVARAGNLGDTANRGVDLLMQARDTAAEMIRSRRDPAAVARRRYVAARRRLAMWSVITILAAAGTAGVTMSVLDGGATTGSVAGLVLLSGLLIYSLVATAQAAVHHRRRLAVVRALPAPQPRRRAVAAAVRPEMTRLDGYSDALRLAVGSLCSSQPGQPADAMRALRDETFAAADAAETRLREKAAEWTALTRASSSPEDVDVARMREQLVAEITSGVAEYGRLVVAASDAAAARRDLVASTSVGTAAGQGIGEITERLTALAHGMRELTHGRAGER